MAGLYVGSPYVGKWLDMNTGEMDGECTTVFHVKATTHRATHYDRSQQRWVCFTCAQQRNRELIQRGVDTKIAGCVSSRDYMLELLMK